MKTHTIPLSAVGIALLLVMAFGPTRAQTPAGEGAPPAANSSSTPGGDAATPLGTGFTYQGQLGQNGVSFDGACDFRFVLYDAVELGEQVGPLQEQTSVSVAGGLFNIANLDFGDNAFGGEARWLEVAVRCPAGSGEYTMLTPRQALMAAPYALYSKAGPWSGLTGVPSGFADNVDNDTTYTAGTGLTLSGGQFSMEFAGSGDANTVARSDHNHDAAYVNEGQADSVSSAMIANGTIKFEDVGANGCSANQVMQWNGTAWVCADQAWSGGADWSLTGNAGTTAGTNFLGTTDNQALELKVNNLRALRLEPTVGSANLIGGYTGNTVAADVQGATVGGGGSSDGCGSGLLPPCPNSVTGDYGTISGGRGNLASGDSAAIGGGRGNVASGDSAAIGGGRGNVASGVLAAVGGGGGGPATTVNGPAPNVASGYAATVGGGSANQSSGIYSLVGGGYNNVASGAETPPCFLNRCWGNATVAGGRDNTASGVYATVGGGYSNQASGTGATIAGGSGNVAPGIRAFVGGGSGNNIAAEYATVVGGQNNKNTGYAAALGGGSANTVSDYYATLGGGLQNKASGYAATTGGGAQNKTENHYATVSGGQGNGAAGYGAVVGGGLLNVAESFNYPTVSGGYRNLAGANSATVGGGESNQARGGAATISGGKENATSGLYSAIGGGYGNKASGEVSVVGGGYRNEVTGYAATVLGGYQNVAEGNVSLAAGTQAYANARACFVWSDDSWNPSDDTTVQAKCRGSQSWVVRARGGVYFFTDAALHSGTYLASGSGTWSSASDRALKENFAPTDGQAVLERLAAIPIATWNYKSQAPSIRHIGPVAQDFYAAFGVGEDDKHITTIDADGVALAAIQELYRLVQVQNAEISDLRARIEALEEFIADPEVENRP